MISGRLTRNFIIVRIENQYSSKIQVPSSRSGKKASTWNLELGSWNFFLSIIINHSRQPHVTEPVHSAYSLDQPVNLPALILPEKGLLQS